MQNCHGGNHRASVMGKFTTAILNEIIDDDGNRKFNAKLFAIEGRASQWVGSAEETLQSAREWLTEAWDVVPAILAGEFDNVALHRQFYGFEACNTSRGSIEKWGECFALIAKYSSQIKMKEEVSRHVN